MVTKSIVINRSFLETQSFNYLTQSFCQLSSVSRDYPNFRHWFNHTVVPGIYYNKRFLCLKVISQEIVAIAILKNSFLEKKICTLWVDNNFKGLGLGNELFNQSFDLLKTSNPMITISSTKIDEFEHLLDEYNFQIYAAYDSFYVQGVTELSFNGYLSKQSPLSSNLKADLSFNSMLQPSLSY